LVPKAVFCVGVLAIGYGCAGGQTPHLRGSPADAVHAAAERTREVGSAQVDISVGEQMVGSGRVDLAHGRAELTFRRAGVHARTGDRFEIVVDGGQGWLSVAPGGNGRWLSGDLGTLARDTGRRIAPLDGLLVRPGAGLDLAFLRGAENVLPYGGEEVRGTSTLRYSFVVDLAAAIAATPVTETSALGALRTAAVAIGPVRFPADVWLDSAGRVRRIQLATDPKLRTTTTAANFFTPEGVVLSFIVIDLHDFGVPVRIAPPPAESVSPVG